MPDQTDNQYSYPVEQSKVTLIVEQSPGHEGTYKGSIDFAVPLGIDVMAAADGVVTRVREDSDVCGNDPK